MFLLYSQRRPQIELGNDGDDSDGPLLMVRGILMMEMVAIWNMDDDRWWMTRDPRTDLTITVMTIMTKRIAVTLSPPTTSSQRPGDGDGRPWRGALRDEAGARPEQLVLRAPHVLPQGAGEDNEEDDDKLVLCIWGWYLPKITRALCPPISFPRVQLWWRWRLWQCKHFHWKVCQLLSGNPRKLIIIKHFQQAALPLSSTMTLYNHFLWIVEPKTRKMFKYTPLKIKLIKKS